MTNHAALLVAAALLATASFSLSASTNALAPGNALTPTNMLAREGNALAAESSATISRQDAHEPFRPGLGEIMANNQRHHAALFFAGKAGNWELASYELKEIEEGLADAKEFWPMHEDVNVKELIEAIGPPATKRLHQSIEKADKNMFVEGFTVLTVACNACHASAKVPFISIIEPTAPPATNQRYDKR